MPGTIQLRAPGFLSLLQLKTTGQLPSDLGSQVAPTVDMTRWYLNDCETIIISSFTSVGTALITVGTVPQGEMWYVHEVSGFVIGAGTHMLQAACLMGAGQPRTNRGGEIASFTMVGAAARLYAPALTDFFAFPGDGLVLNAQSTVGALVMVGTARITRITPPA